MISLNKIYALLIILITIMFSFSNKASAEYDKLIYDFEIESITGEKIDFSKYKSKVILLVNVASKCGFTKQYTDLQKLWETYKDKGLIVVLSSIKVSTSMFEILADEIDNVSG